MGKDYLLLCALAFKIHEFNLAKEMLDKEGERVAKLTEQLYSERNMKNENPYVSINDHDPALYAANLS